MEVNVFQDPIAVSLPVGEVHMIEIDRSVGNLHDRIFPVRDIRLLVNNFGDSLCGGGRHGNHNENHSQHHEGHEDIHAVCQQRHEFAGRQLVLNNHMCSEPGDREYDRVDRSHHDRHIDDDVVLSLYEQIVDICRGLCELVILIFLTDIGLDYADGADVFLNTFVHCVILFKYHLEILCRSPHY